MKRTYCFILLMLAICIVSCNESEKKEDSPKLTLKVESTLGALEDFLTIEDKVTIKLEKTKEGFVLKSSLGMYVNKPIASDNSFYFETEVLDKDHIKIADFISYELESEYDWDNSVSFLSSGKKWAKIDQDIDKENWSEEYEKDWEEICKEGAYLVLKSSSFSEFKAYKGSASNETDETDEEVDSEPKVEVTLPSSLKGNVEIVSANKRMDSDGYPKVDITFKLLQKVNTSSLCSSYGQMWIVGHAQDEKGSNINDLNPKSISSREWRTEDSDGSLFKDCLEGDPGETISLEFIGENNIELFENDAAKIASGKATTEAAFEKFKKFRLSVSN